MDGAQSSVGQANLVGWSRHMSPLSKLHIHHSIPSLAILSFLFSTYTIQRNELMSTSAVVKELQ